MYEIKIGDIVRMKPHVDWVEPVRKYLNTPLVVTGTHKNGYPMLTLSLLDGAKLVNEGSAEYWSFHPLNLEHDVYLMAVRARRHAAR